MEKAGLKLNIQKTKIMASGPVTSWQIDGEKVEAVADFIFLGSKIIVDGNCNHEIKSYDKPRQPIKKQRHHFADKGLYSQSYDFSSSHVWMWEVDQKEGLATEELTLSNCVAREDSWESFGQQGDQTTWS